MKKNVSFPRLPNCELEVMKVIWDQNQPISQMQIKEELGVRLKRNYCRTTVATWLTRLNKKHFLVVTEKDGLLHYQAAIPRSDYEEMEVHLLADRLFQGSLPGIVAAMAEKDILTAEEEAEIRGIMDRWTDTIPD